MMAVGEGWFAGSGIRKCILPQGVVEIQEGAFAGCTKLKEIELPDSLERLGAICFAGSGLRGVKIPKNVVEISEKAFLACRGLQEVTFETESRLARMGYAVFSKTGIHEV